MKTRLIAMGLWVRWIILGLLHPIGMVHITCGLARQLYRANRLARNNRVHARNNRDLLFIRKPLWTVVILHLVLLMALLWIAAILFCRVLELFWANPAYL